MQHSGAFSTFAHQKSSMHNSYINKDSPIRRFWRRSGGNFMVARIKGIGECTTAVWLGSIGSGRLK